MASTQSPDTLSHPQPGSGHDEPKHTGIWKRPLKPDGLVGWLTTVDHKKIGIAYAIAALFFFLIGGVEALLIRVQLFRPEQELISAELYNRLFTMHGTTMIFLAVMPLSTAFFNYIMPLQIGARDVAFPRLNALGLWTFILGGILVNLSWIFPGSAPGIGWFGYAPLTGREFSPDIGTDFWVLGLQILGIASLVGSFNFITTILNMRAPGLSMMRLPLFTWMTLITSFLIILAFPAITIALVELMFDRHFGTMFFDVLGGGKPILWQHLFWVFGHPEVYILILPAMGIISEVLPVFSRKPLFGYPLVVFSGAVIGFLGFAVWSHHMFTTGLGVVATSAFAFLTMLISIPTGVKIFNWIGTMWGGRITFTTPMLFAVGFIWMFMIGGFTGIMHSSPPVDSQQQDTYFVVAHFHYVLIGGSIFALFAGLYYWFPKVSGRMLNETWGKLVFYTMFVGFNMAFFPMHILGMTGMPRRTHTYQTELGLNGPNMWSTIGAFLLGFGVLLFIVQLIYSAKKGKPAGRDPWDARTLEWVTDSPPKFYNFAYTPVVHARDQFFESKHGQAERKMEKLAPDAHGIHMPDQSWWPLILGFGLFIAAFGMVLLGQPREAFPLIGGLLPEGEFSIWNVCVPGLALTLFAAYGWAYEGPGGYHVHPTPAEVQDDEIGTVLQPGSDPQVDHGPSSQQQP
ncbi:MAG: cytochrome c oxidase subunit I [Puniceicoccaceae bacterium 5H]|nr:MAG: cytochrome c oxidase subunit I [Puniceicoccaceae bacterium 5H]